MGKRDEGGRAFPNLDGNGMTLRQFYKGMALAGIFSRGWEIRDDGKDVNTPGEWAGLTGELADALIAEDKEDTRGKA